MKTIRFLSLALAGTALFYLSSCKKETSASGVSTPDQISQSAISLQAVAVGTVDNGTTASSADSIYVLHICEPHHRRDSIAFTSLPATALDYLNTNYAGYTTIKAFVIKDSSGTVKGYVAIINFNGNPVGVRFDANGAFVKVLEQREGRDLDGKGWHAGGCFGNRDGQNRDTIALAQLPDSVTAWFAANAASDTLVKAFKQHNGEILVISRNNGAFATVFTSGGSFLKREEFHPAKGHAIPVPEAQLPAGVTGYITTTYPGAVIKMAFSIQDNNNPGGFLVFIDANNTKYALVFDAAGNFLKVIPVR
jgi:hypothetical protein